MINLIPDASFYNDILNYFLYNLNIAIIFQYYSQINLIQNDVNYIIFQNPHLRTFNFVNCYLNLHYYIN